MENESLPLKILCTLNEGHSFNDTVSLLLRAIKAYTKFDAVGIRLRKDEDFPYFAQDGFSHDFLLTENSLVARDSTGVCRDASGRVSLECTCGLVLCGKADPTSALFTDYGSAWINQSTNLLKLTAAEDPRIHPRNRCVHEGYLSVALVPIRHKDEIIGLLQLNDSRPDRLTLDTVKYFEKISNGIGIALVRIQEQEAIRQAETKYRGIFQEASSGISVQQMIFNDKNEPIDYVTIDMNPAAEKLLGVKKEDALNIRVSSLLPPEEFKKWLKLFSDVVTKNTRAKYELESPTNKKIFEGHVFCHKPGYFSVVFDDITLRAHTENIISRSQKLESLGLLAGGIAHDFNNILSGIFGYMDMAKSITKEAKASRYLDKAMGVMDRARALTAQLNTFSVGGAPRKSAENLFPFIEETAQFALSGSTISCVVAKKEDLWPCDIDRNQIGQVVENIVINAQQALPNDGSIYISAVNITISDHPVLSEGHYVEVDIKDQGIGIPKDIISKIFDPFYTTKEKGHGLGLSTCHSIISRHGGCIEVDSEPGVGSTFKIFLPAIPSATAQENETVDTIHKGSGTLLLMDDEQHILDVVSGMLHSMGYSTITANDGETALESCKDRKDIIGMIFDLTVPGGMGGRELIKKIREQGLNATAFVSSGYADNPVMANPKKYGFTACIPKPFKMSELSKLLNKHMK